MVVTCPLDAEQVLIYRVGRSQRSFIFRKECAKTEHMAVIFKTF